ncbi:hypothetical protein VTK26DRAFT_3851 [Humicola hyalothermophila]
MELADVEASGSAGAPIIKVRRGVGPARHARAAFEFELQRWFTLGEFVDVIEGRHGDLPGHFRWDMSGFMFVEMPDEVAEYDGCRDWIMDLPVHTPCAQAFLRLHALHWVGWSVAAIFLPSLTLENDDDLPVEPTPPPSMCGDLRALPPTRPVDWDRAGFHDVIAKNFNEVVSLSANLGEIRRIMYNDLPLVCGTFVASRAQRFGTDYTGRYSLLYREPQMPQPGARRGRNGNGGHHDDDYDGDYHSGYTTEEDMPGMDVDGGATLEGRDDYMAGENGFEESRDYDEEDTYPEYEVPDDMSEVAHETYYDMDDDDDMSEDDGFNYHGGGEVELPRRRDTAV